MIFTNGDVYEGQWQASQKHGRGCYCWKNGVVFEGEFWHDKREGQGAVHYPNGLPDGKLLAQRWQVDLVHSLLAFAIETAIFNSVEKQTTGSSFLQYYHFFLTMKPACLS